MEESVERYASVCVRLRLQVSFRHYILRRLRWEDEKWSLIQLLLLPCLPVEHKFAPMAAVAFFFFVFVYAPTEPQLIIFSSLSRH